MGNIFSTNKNTIIRNTKFQNNSTLSYYIQKLPKELINIVIDYIGSIKYRNGIYMNQITDIENKYKILKTIPLLSSPDVGLTDTSNFIYITINFYSNVYKSLICFINPTHIRYQFRDVSKSREHDGFYERY